MSYDVQHNIIVSGAPPGPDGALPIAYSRLPIEDLVKDEKQFALYVQAIEMMKKTSSSDMLSWFQISGIHGMPAEPWDNVRGNSDSPWKGYCTHSSVLFPTWHRQYVLLFEQALVGSAIKIAESYTGADAADWKQAATSLRSPYWDWARTSVPPDEVIKSKTLTVPGPNGCEIVLDPNPLLGYRFPADAPTVDHRPQTVRCPTKDSPNESNLQALLDSLRVLDNPNNPMSALVWATLQDANSWESFSNTRTSKGAYVNSLESLHNRMHVVVGGDGHMGDAAVAGFDPIFWLHHTNVDRLLALWQGLHPDVWVSPVTSSGESGTFTISRDAHVNENTDLTPFWSGAATFHQSATPGVRQWELLNYNYPEFVQLPRDADTRAAISAALKRLYLDDDDDDDDDDVDEGEDKEPAVPSRGQPSSGRQNVDWFARIRVQPGKADSSFTVMLFAGEPPQSEHDWRTADNLIGLHAEFVNSRTDQCSNCQENVDVVTEGFVELTHILRKRGMYKRSDGEIEEFLSRNLEWRIQKIDATIVAAEDVPGLEIAVMSVPLEYSPECYGWKKPEGIRPLPHNATSGRAGGYTPRQD